MQHLYLQIYNNYIYYKYSTPYKKLFSCDLKSKMKTVILFFIIVMTYSVLLAECTETAKTNISPQLVSLVQKCAKSCKTASKVTKEDLEIINLKKIPATETGLSFLECIMEKLGVIRRKKFVKQAVGTTFAALVKNNPEKKAQLKKISEECAVELKKIEDQCTKHGDMANHVLKCFEKYKNDFDVSLPDIKLVV